MAKRGDVLGLAVLGLLHDSPLHGYELRKRLSATLGMFRALSYGSLYPALRDLVTRGWIVEQRHAVREGASAPPPLAGKRGRIVYELTAEGKEQFQDALAESGPSSWEDGDFDVRFAFFAQLDAATRLRILEGRRTRMSERLDNLRRSFARSRERWDDYTLELQRHGLESVEHEVRWLDGLIDNERRGGPAPPGVPPPPGTPGTR